MGRSLRILVVAHNLSGSARFIGPVVEELLERGHRVHVALEPPERKHAGDRWLGSVAAHERFSWGTVESWRRDLWFLVARWLRRSDDYVRYLLIGRDRIPYFVERAEERTPSLTRSLVRLPGLASPPGLALLSRVLSALDRAVPTSRGTVEFFRRRDADVVVLMPILMPGSTDSAYVRAAAAAGIPTVLCVPSWDNLSSKQLIRVLPDAVVVWNETQRREAEELHRIPRERVVVTGAQCFDHWFGWLPSGREEFCRRVGLDPERRYILYAGGALFPTTLTEAEFARRWVEALRTSGDPRLREIGVLIRPHPKRVEQWKRVRFDDLPGVSVWPREPRPTGADADPDYFDSIYYGTAMVGLNTSAMIEAAIVDKPVLTVLVPEFHGSQRGTLHFDYLLDLGEGFVQTAVSLEEHVSQLSSLLNGEQDAGREARRRFVRSFVRPHGLGQAATPVFADAIESAARAGLTVHHDTRPSSRLLRLVLLPGLANVFGRRVRLKLALELRRIARRAPTAAT